MRTSVAAYQATYIIALLAMVFFVYFGLTVVSKRHFAYGFADEDNRYREISTADDRAASKARKKARMIAESKIANLESKREAMEVERQYQALLQLGGD